MAVITTVKADARNRFVRTLWQGFGLDALVLIGSGLLILLETGDVLTPVFWIAVLVLIVRSILMAAAAYLARLKLPPNPQSSAVTAPSEGQYAG